MKVRIIAILLCLCCLAGCSAKNAGDTADKSEIELQDSTNKGKVVAVSTSDGKFTLKCNLDSTLNPFECDSADNAVVDQLLYETLFCIEDDFSAVPCLCESYSTTDGLTYRIKLKTDVYMTDGELMTAADVVYSLDEARESDRYYGRLRNISATSWDEEDEYTVIIDLETPDYYLPQILDLPIIREDSADEDLPAGTGPYYYTNSVLEVFEKHRDAEKMPVDTIYLKSFGDDVITEAFASGELDLLWDDPYDDEQIQLRGDHEVRMCDTTKFQYLAFNMMRATMESRELRKLVELAVDREAITSDIFKGNAAPAETLCHPSSWLYTDPGKEKDTVENLVKALYDYDKDGWLDLPDRDGEWYDIDMEIAVYEGSTEKVNAARSICDTLAEWKIRCKVVPLAWNDYLEAVEDGLYEIYYAEVTVPANFDFRRILESGGSLNYGAYGDDELNSLLYNYLAAGSDESKITAMGELAEYVRYYAPIVPILYRRTAVHTMRGVIRGITPTQSNVFYPMSEWTLKID